MKPIKTDIDRILGVLEDIKPEMHPGDYSGMLANIVHYALTEAERISRHLGNNDPLIESLREMETVASTLVPRNPNLH